MAKAFARRGERLSNSIRLGAFGTQGRFNFGALRFVRDYLWRGFSHFKLGANSLDLRGLVFELGDHGLHFALQLTDARLLFLNFLPLFHDFGRKVTSPS